MDVSKFKTSDWLKIGGGALMLIAGFLPWGRFEFGGFGSRSWNAFGFFFRGTIPWLLVVGVGVIAFLLITDMMKAGSTPWSLIMIGAAGLATLLVLIMLLTGPSKDGVDLDRGIGLFLGFIAAVASLVGSVMGFKESGGDLNDLKDFDKLKSAFGSRGSGSAGGSGGSGSSPPPPPTGGTPPPPPPPPDV